MGWDVNVWTRDKGRSSLGLEARYLVIEHTRHWIPFAETILLEHVSTLCIQVDSELQVMPCMQSTNLSVYRV